MTQTRLRSAQKTLDQSEKNLELWVLSIVMFLFTSLIWAGYRTTQNDGDISHSYADKALEKVVGFSDSAPKKEADRPELGY